MKSISKLLVVLVIASLLQGCIVVNYARGEKNVCELHNTKMNKCTVRSTFGKARYTKDATWPHAKERQNLGCVVTPWPFRRFVRIYHCGVCDSVKKINFKAMKQF